MEKGYFEINQLADLWRMPVTAFAGNVIYNGRHWHEHMEIIFCLYGETKVTIEDEEYLLKPGDFVTINSEAAHESSAGQKDNLQIICSVRKDALNDMDDHELSCATIMSQSVSDTDAAQLRHILCQLALFVTDYNNFTREEECLKNLSYQYRLLSILAKYKKKIKGTKTKHETLVSNIVCYINEHMTEKIDAGILADYFHVSQSTIYRLFYKEMGVHLNEYITSLRVSAACRMLQNQKQTVTEIAYACGFTGLSNFYRVFREMMHVTPKEYQKNHPHIKTQYVLHQPDIMQLNQFQTFWETGYDAEVLKNAF